MDLLKYIKAVRHFGMFCHYPGRSYGNLNNCSSTLFERLPETYSKDARAALEATDLGDDEIIVSLNVNSL